MGELTFVAEPDFFGSVCIFRVFACEIDMHMVRL